MDIESFNALRSVPIHFPSNWKHCRVTNNVHTIRLKKMPNALVFYLRYSIWGHTAIACSHGILWPVVIKTFVKPRQWQKLNVLKSSTTQDEWQTFLWAGSNLALFPLAITWFRCLPRKGVILSVSYKFRYADHTIIFDIQGKTHCKSKPCNTKASVAKYDRVN